MIKPEDLPLPPALPLSLPLSLDTSQPASTPKKKSRGRKTSTKPTRVYSYRILPPEVPEHRKLVDEQFFLAHQYRSRLIEIEIELRASFHAIDLDHSLTREAYSTWEACSATVDSMYTELRAAKSGKAPEQRELGDLRDRILEGKRACSKAWGAVKIARADPGVKAHHQPRYSSARENAAALRLAARADFSAQGLMHGTYIRVEQAIERSVDSTGRPPKFLRYEGEGLIGRQLPRTRDKEGRLYSVTAEDLYTGADTRVRMTPLPAGWEQLSRTARRRGAKPYRGTAKRQPHGEGWQEIPARFDGQYLEMQFGWKPAERPSTWIRFPLTQHRRLPDDAEILWVHICRWRIGIHYEWRVQLTIESDTFHRPAAPTASGGTCAIDIGWRRILDGGGNQIGLRVAYLVDEHGKEREIRAPDGLWQRLAKVYSLAQIRSRSLDQIRDRLVAWIEGKPLPQWFVDRAKGLPQWRAPRKLQRLIDTWKREENRLDEDAEVLVELLAWAKQDRHLATWEAHMRDRTIANRREVWRQIAAELARTYQTILVEDGLCRSEGREGQMKIVDIEGWDKLPPEDGDPHEGREQRRQSRMAAPGELRLAITQAVHKTASTVIDVARAKKSTRECAWCGHMQKHADFAATISIQCEGCGRVWDQDANAARNLLHRRGLTSGQVPALPANAVSSAEVRAGGGRPLAKDSRAKRLKKSDGGARRDAGDEAV
jgi:transposase